MVTFKGANLITVTFQTKPHWPPGHRELAFLRTFNFHATTGAPAIKASRATALDPLLSWARRRAMGAGTKRRQGTGRWRRGY